MTESRQGINVETIPCRCGTSARRVAVYAEQYMHAETGPKIGRKEPVATSRQRYRDFREASAEIEHAEQTQGVKAPNYFKQAKREARKRVKA